MAGPGHNSGVSEADAALTLAARDKLRSVVAQIEKLEEEKKEAAEMIADAYREAKAMGYDTKALRAVIRRRKQDRQSVEEFEAILEVYLLAIGDIA
jgi:uncharacterized protein (UPF0335 family)